MRLHFQTMGAGEPIVLLHGLLGSGDNWLGIAPKLAPHFRLLIPDLRNHGRSPHAADMSFAAMAGDVAELLDAQGIERAVVVGHSLGGKVAMQLAAANPERMAKLVVEDIAPRAYPPVYRSILEAMLAVEPAGCATRSQVEEQLATGIPERNLRQFLLKNLGRDAEGRLYWRCHLSGIAGAYDELRSGLELPVLKVPALFITGADSRHVQAEDRKLIAAHFPAGTFAEIAGAGHWVHGDQPEEFARVVMEWLAKSAPFVG